MTTGRTITVPGQRPPPNANTPPPPARPESRVLREYELLYSVEYTAPATTVSSEVASEEPEREVRPPRESEERERPPARAACRRI